MNNYDVPAGVPSEFASKDPADTIRDIFLINKGRLTIRQTEAMLGRLSFTYGGKERIAWQGLLTNGYCERDNDDYVWPVQERYAIRTWLHCTNVGLS